MMWNLQSYPTTVLNDRIDIFREVKTYSDLSYIISGGGVRGSGPLIPRIYAPKAAT